MKFLTQDAVLKCLHRGRVEVALSQTMVTIAGRRVLVDPDPERRDIDRCPNRSPTIKKCNKTLVVRGGYSVFMRIDGKRICLDSVWGLTNGTPPGMVKYQVFDPGQDYVSGAT